MNWTPINVGCPFCETTNVVLLDSGVMLCNVCGAEW